MHILYDKKTSQNCSLSGKRKGGIERGVATERLMDVNNINMAYESWLIYCNNNKQYRIEQSLLLLWIEHWRTKHERLHSSWIVGMLWQFKLNLLLNINAHTHAHTHTWAFNVIWFHIIIVNNNHMNANSMIASTDCTHYFRIVNDIPATFFICVSSWKFKHNRQFAMDENYIRWPNWFCIGS